MVTGVVEYDDHAAFWRLLAQQSHEEALESHGVEDRTHHANELTAAQADSAETSHGLAGRRMRQSFFRRDSQRIGLRDWRARLTQPTTHLSR